MTSEPQQCCVSDGFDWASRWRLFSLLVSNSRHANTPARPQGHQSTQFATARRMKGSTTLTPFSHPEALEQRDVVRARAAGAEAQRANAHNSRLQFPPTDRLPPYNVSLGMAACAVGPACDALESDAMCSRRAGAAPCVRLSFGLVLLPPICST